jgi:protein-tyrosine phosphatase
MYLLKENLIDFVASDIHNNFHIEEIKNLLLNKSQKQYLPNIIENTKNTFIVS